jgi:hypothetical protein
MPVPTKFDVTHYRGDTLALAVTLWDDDTHTVPSDLSAAKIAAEVRTAPSAPDVVTSFAVSVVGNVVTLTLDAEQSQELPPKCSYDVEVDWTGDRSRVQTVVQGALTITADVTRPVGAPDRSARG